MARFSVPEWLAEQLGLAADAVTLVSIHEVRGLRAYYRADGRSYVVMVRPVADAKSPAGITWTVRARRNSGDRALIAETTSPTPIVFGGQRPGDGGESIGVEGVPEGR